MATEHVVERVSTKLNDPCLASAKEDEPIFVLRAQDLTAPVVVVFWILMTMLVGWWMAHLHGYQAETSDNTLRAAFEQALRMRKWDKRKIAD